MLVAIGTKNPAKVRAVTRAFRKAFPKARFKYIPVESGVSEQPLGIVETRNGAMNRATGALQKCRDAEIGVGVEGGVENTRHGLMICGFVYIVDRAGRSGVGSTISMMIPRSLARKVLSGKTLGDVMNEHTGKKNLHTKGGAIGYLTKNITTREEAFRLATAAALAPFLHKELYDRQ
jgi:inosine/xanthosine triphosphatase